MFALPFKRSDFRRQIETELTSNILPFWMAQGMDRVHGGFYGAVTNDLKVQDEVPRSAILAARILWTYATAFRRTGMDAYQAVARRAYETLSTTFWDREHGGVFWQVGVKGVPVVDRKVHYAQAFAIYGLSAYYRATRESESLALAQRLFDLLEAHAYDPAHQGYTEGSGRAWETLGDVRLSAKDLDCRKSMNTMLHLLEAYTELWRAWGEETLRVRLQSTLETFLGQIIDRETGHLQLFFDERWRPLSRAISYGHDIEASWLLVEAAEALGEPELMERVRAVALQLAAAVLREGVDEDGSLFYEGGPDGPHRGGKEWWGQAEAVVGFYNAFQLGGGEHYAAAAYRCWRTIEEKWIDRQHGDWFKRLHRDGSPDEGTFKIGPWEGPYHHSRACFEMLDRLERS